MTDRLRWGILGTGGIANFFTSDLKLTGFTVSAVGSRNTDTAEAFAATHGIPTAYGSYEELVADPEVDVVYVSTPHPFHAENATLALEAGKHVLVEKPFTLNQAEARAVVDLATSKGLVVLEAMWTRWLPAHGGRARADRVRSDRRGPHAHRRPRPEAPDRSGQPLAGARARRRRAARPGYLSDLLRLGPVRRAVGRARHRVEDADRRRPADRDHPRLRRGGAGRPAHPARRARPGDRGHHRHRGPDRDRPGLVHPDQLDRIRPVRRRDRELRREGARAAGCSSRPGRSRRSWHPVS